MKIDVFIAKSRVFDQEEFRRVRLKILEGSDRPF